MTGFLKVGVNRVDGIDFLVADPRKYREDARLKAVRAAREKANKTADSGGAGAVARQAVGTYRRSQSEKECLPDRQLRTAL